MFYENGETIYEIEDLPKELRELWISTYDMDGEWNIIAGLKEWMAEFIELGYTQKELDKLFFPMIYGGKDDSDT